MMLKRRTHLFLSVPLFIILSASIAVGQSKLEAPKVEKTPLVAPPKTISDITAILDEQKLIKPEAIAEDLLVSRLKVPPEYKGAALAEFYFERGQSAGRVGNITQQIRDLEMAVKISIDLKMQEQSNYLRALAIAELYAGSFSQGLEHYQAAVNLIPQDRLGLILSRNAVLAYLLAANGDLKGAEERFAIAENMFYQARSGWRSWGRWGETWTNVIHRAKANILEAKGLINEAEAHYRTALFMAEVALEKKPDNPIRALLVENAGGKLARNLTRQGKLVEAEVVARSTLLHVLGRLGRNHPQTALYLRNFTDIIIEQHRFQEAEKLALTGIDIFRRLDVDESSWQMAMTRRSLAKIFVNLGKWEQAISEFDTIKKNLASDQNTFGQFFAGDLDWAVALVEAGRANESKEISGRTFNRNFENMGAKHFDTAEARGIFAMALAASDEKTKALEGFQTSIPILLSNSRHSQDSDSSEAATTQRINLILESYVTLLADIVGTPVEQKANIDAAAEAFRIADVARSRSVQAALAASAARAAAKDEKLSELVRQEQDAQKQIASLFGTLANHLSNPKDKQDAIVVETLRTIIDETRTERAALAKAIKSDFPEYAELINPKPASIEAVQALMRDDEALISTYVGRKRTFVWAVPKSGKTAFASVKLNGKQIAGVVKDIRTSLDPRATTLGDIPAFNARLSHRLYKLLLEPVKAGWQKSKSLLIVANGALGQLPFSVLVTAPPPEITETGDLFSVYKKVPWLVRTHAVTVLPSVTSLASLRALPKANPSRKPFVGFGDPYFNEAQAAEAEAAPVKVASLQSRGAFNVRSVPLRLRAAPATEKLQTADLGVLPRLPDTLDEVRSIAIVLKADLTEDVYTGLNATESFVKKAGLKDYKVIAFATHGLVPGDLNGLLQPALALTSPKVSGDKDEDGLLTMGEILELRLDADWVVLSACNTGAGNGAGAEAFSGLGRAFFYAGTRAILLSNWPVESTSARLLTTGVFKRQAEQPDLSRAQALRQSMLALIDGEGFVDEATKKVVFSYAHPIFWAPFTLLGDGGV